MGHPVGVAQLGHRRGGVAPAHDGHGAALGQSPGQGTGALGKGGELKDAHGAVPDDGARVFHRAGEGLDGLGADVHAHAAVGDGHGVHKLRRGVGGKLGGAQGVGGQQEGNALLLGLGHHLPAVVQPVGLQQGGAHAAPQGLDKGIRHAAADDDGVGHVQQVADDADLGGHLGPAQNGHQRALGIAQSAAHDLQLLFDKEAGHGGQIGGDARGGGVGAVDGAEGVGHVEVGHGGEGAGKVGVVLLLAGLEPEVFQQHDLTALEGGGLGVGVGADHVGGENDLLAQQLAQAPGHGGQGQLRFDGALGLAQVGAGDDRRAMAQQVAQGGQGGHDAGIVGDGAGGFVLGHVEVAAAQHPLAGHVYIAHAFLVVIHSSIAPFDSGNQSVRGFERPYRAGYVMGLGRCAGGALTRSAPSRLPRSNRGSPAGAAPRR